MKGRLILYGKRFSGRKGCDYVGDVGGRKMKTKKGEAWLGLGRKG
jgi:hypothetical protein